MTLRDPLWLQVGEYSASDDRLPLFNTFVELTGVVSDTQMWVTPTSGMNVEISSGYAVVPGNAVSGQGHYSVANVGSSVLTLDPGTTKPRYDYIILRIRDSQVSGSFNDAIFDVVKGAASNSPVYPKVPNMAVVIAGVRVNAGANSLSSSHIDNTLKWRATLRRDMGASIIPVRSREEANRLADRTSVSASAPLIVFRADAHPSSKIEYTTDGKNWNRVTPLVSNGNINIGGANYSERRANSNTWYRNGNTVSLNVSIRRTGANYTLPDGNTLPLTDPIPSGLAPPSGGILGVMDSYSGLVRVGVNSDNRFFIQARANLEMKKDTWWVEGQVTYHI